MKKTFFVFIVLNTAICFAQLSEYKKVKKEYDSFEYENVIKYSESIIKQKNLPDSLLIDLYLMRAVSFYAIGEEDSTRQNFKDILKINSDYVADPSKISPKLIAIFEQVKINFFNEIKSVPTQYDSIKISSQKFFDYNFAKNSFFRNFLLPGSGQIYYGDKLKGIILSTISILNLGSIFYYIYDTNKKEKDYLNELDFELIQKKYEVYNKSYKIRNTLIISYIAIWLYSQLDLLFFSGSEIFMRELINMETSRMLFNSEGIQFSIRMRLSF